MKVVTKQNLQVVKLMRFCFVFRVSFAGGFFVFLGLGVFGDDNAGCRAEKRGGTARSRTRSRHREGRQDRLFLALANHEIGADEDARDTSAHLQGEHSH